MVQPDKALAAFHQLMEISFCHPKMIGGPETAESLRARYAAALAQLSKFTTETGGRPEVAERFAELSSALMDLERGTVHPVLEPNAAHNRTTDRDDIWSCRTSGNCA